jgi:ATP-dependent DNA helicase DinG
MRWPDVVAAYFQPEGWLQEQDPHFVPRIDQATMARAVAQTIEDSGRLVIEAGTGVGKTYAYLIPALLSGKKTLISTATRNLQDQLFGRDIPYLLTRLGLPLKTALLKGRSSYLCLHRMDLADQHMSNRQAQSALAAVRKWSLGTSTGDLTQMSGLDEKSPLWPWITSTRENCLGSECPKSRECHVNLARREALAADLTVINHHLFFADLVIRESGQAQLLPAVQTVVFDEAHQLNEVGIQFLGEELSSTSMLELARDILGAGLQYAKGVIDWRSQTAQLEQAIRDWRLLWPAETTPSKWRWTAGLPGPVQASEWNASMQDMRVELLRLDAALTNCEEASPELVRLKERVMLTLKRIDQFLAPPVVNRVRWVETARGVRLVESPLEIGGWMDEKVWSKETTPDQGAQSFVFTSATLGDEPQLKWFTEPMGLSGAQTVCLGSPFDYGRQSAVYVPLEAPHPSSSEHADFVAEIAYEAVQRLGGKTMVLTTSVKSLQRISSILNQRLSDPSIQVLVQGKAAKNELLRQFKEAGAQKSDRQESVGAVLVATASFWEGVDIAGDALMCVVIDKLPFPMPSDPWVQARCEQLDAQGGSSFREFSIPAAAVALKQGAGRLIRQETDRGILVICDNRLTNMSYGKRLRQALPSMQPITTRSDFLSYLLKLQEHLLTKVSTKGAQ